MKINLLNNYLFQSAFGTRKKFKRMFKKCAYSGLPFEVHNTKTIEHIIPKSRSGSDDIGNLICIRKDKNMERSSKKLSDYLKEHPEVKQNIIDTVNSLEGKEIDGVIWSDEVKKTLLTELGYDIFEKKL